MIITNKYRLPQLFVDLVKDGLYPPQEGRYSVTQSIAPPLIRTLRMKYWDKIETDVSEYLWMILGKAVDKLLSEQEGYITQHKIEHTLETGEIIVGVIDLINEDSIEDWKATSVKSFYGGVKPEWVEQLNLYALLRELERRKAQQNGETIIPVRHLRINAILRDWTVTMTNRKDYPTIPFQQFSVKKWSFDEQMAFLKRRISDHKNNPERECTPKEKWQKETTYALMKKGRQSAVMATYKGRDGIGIYPISENECIREALKAKKVKKWPESGYYIEERPGDKIRCHYYCSVRGICPYVK